MKQLIIKLRKKISFNYVRREGKGKQFKKSKKIVNILS